MNLKIKKTRQDLLDDIKEQDKIITVLRKSSFLSKQYDIGNLVIFTNIIGNSYVEYNIIDGGTSDIKTDNLTYVQWKAKVCREFKKVGLVHDKDTYLSYKLK